LKLALLASGLTVGFAGFQHNGRQQLQFSSDVKVGITLTTTALKEVRFGDNT
jgi:hypothetical protein